LGFNLDNVVLAELDIPDPAAVNAQLNELLRPDGERLEPADEYEARDASGTIRVAVDAVGDPSPLPPNHSTRRC
jgi:hypothetical protein